MYPVSVRKIMGKIVNIPIYIMAFFIVVFFYGYGSCCLVC